jgi:prevent-host-death family protein
MTIMTNAAQPLTTWTVAQAKAKLSEVLDRAHSEGPQRIARRGKRAVIVVPEREWLAAQTGPGEIPFGVGTIVEFFRTSGLPELGFSDVLDAVEAERRWAREDEREPYDFPKD